MKHLRSLLILLVLGSGLVARAADTTKATLKFSDPAKPGTLNVYLGTGDVVIHGADTDTITVSSEATADTPAKPRDDGLRVISTASGFSLTESANVATLDYGRDAGPAAASADFDITAPSGTTIHLVNAWGGNTSITGIHGRIEVKALNGDVKLNQIAAGAVVETLNGDIDVTSRTLAPDQPLSFASMNGKITLRVPVDAKATVRLRSQSGSILTDFSEKALVTKVDTSATDDPSSTAEAARRAARIAREVADQVRDVAEQVRDAVHEEFRDYPEAPKAPAAPAPGATARAPRAPRIPAIPPVTGGKVVNGTLNGGGTDIQVTTMNGDIILRKN